MIISSYGKLYLVISYIEYDHLITISNENTTADNREYDIDAADKILKEKVIP
jgi:hypothetical protein